MDDGRGASTPIDGGRPLTLRDIVTRAMPPEPWAEGENLPWDDPAFSERMLAEHLSQEHDLASRRSEIVDRQVAWIDETLLDGRPTRVLDLACGPGLYTSRLARLDHSCEGIDFAPAAIRHAREEAARQGLDCVYRLEDVREAELRPGSGGFGLVMMLWGQLNVFRRGEARAIVKKAAAALEPGGLLLLEPQRAATVEGGGRAPSTWYSCGDEGGLFSPRAHLCLSEGYWDEVRRSTTQRFYVVDAQTGEVDHWAMTSEAYTDEELVSMLEGEGLRDVRALPSLTGGADGGEAAPVPPTLVVIGRKG